jgi:uncharacterized protein HemX
MEIETADHNPREGSDQKKKGAGNTAIVVIILLVIGFVAYMALQGQQETKTTESNLYPKTRAQIIDSINEAKKKIEEKVRRFKMQQEKELKDKDNESTVRTYYTPAKYKYETVEVLIDGHYVTVQVRKKIQDAEKLTITGPRKFRD